jgi:hypothetical protein
MKLLKLNSRILCGSNPVLDPRQEMMIHEKEVS